MRTADSVRLTCCPPAPLARYTSMRRSDGSISTSMLSSTSGETKTDANFDGTARRAAKGLAEMVRDKEDIAVEVQEMFTKYGALVHEDVVLGKPSESEETDPTTEQKKK